MFSPSASVSVATVYLGHFAENQGKQCVSLEQVTDHKDGNKMHIEQDVVDFEMGDTDAKSGLDSIVGNGDDTDIAAEELTHGSRTNETESELRNEVDNGIANDGQVIS